MIIQNFCFELNTAQENRRYFSRDLLSLVDQYSHDTMIAVKYLLFPHIVVRKMVLKRAEQTRTSSPWKNFQEVYTVSVKQTLKTPNLVAVALNIYVDFNTIFSKSILIVAQKCNLTS